MANIMDIMGISPTSKVWFYFLSHQDYESRISDLLRDLNIGPESAYTVINRFVKFGILTKVRRGGSFFYSLDLNHPVVISLLNLILSIEVLNANSS